MFRCKDTVMSDQDLDAVLERGAKKTQEMQAKLNVAEKGDMLDFSFDDGSGVQVYVNQRWTAEGGHGNARAFLFFSGGPLGRATTQTLGC